MGYAGKPDLTATPVIPPAPAPVFVEEASANKRKEAADLVDSALAVLGENNILTVADRKLREKTGDLFYPAERAYTERTARWKAGDERLVKRYGPYTEE